MFYISSQGHSATSWLSNLLNKQPNVVCFHGTRSIPPYGSGTRDLSNNDFIDALKLLEKNCNYLINFGACHGFYGTELKELVEKNNGSFFAIIRNPIKRINSIFESFAHGYLNADYLEKKTNFYVYDFIKDIEFNESNSNKIYKKYLNLFDYYKKYQKGLNITDKIIRRLHMKFKEYLRIPSVYLNYLPDLYIDKDGHESFIFKNNNIAIFRLIYLFDIACYRTFHFDKDFFDNCDCENIIKMEEMVISEEYINSIIKKILNTQKIYSLDSSFNENLNKHSSINSSMSDLELYTLWPKIFKDIFINYLYKYQTKNDYVKFGYLSKFDF